MYADRVEAGKRLAHLLAGVPEAAIVLGIPRGGVVVGRALADELNLAFDVVLSRKMRAPTQPELAIGAVGPDGDAILDQRVLSEVGFLTDEFLAEETARRAAEVAERLRRYRGDRPPLDVDGRVCIVVDDGIATGSTARAACEWLRRAGAGGIVLAVPVAPERSLEALARVADRVVCPLVPERFFAVGQFYEDFEQVTDDEVVALVRGAVR